MLGQMLRIITEKQVRSCRFAPKRVELLYMKYSWFIIDISCECFITATEIENEGHWKRFMKRTKGQQQTATNRR